MTEEILMVLTTDLEDLRGRLVKAIRVLEDMHAKIDGVQLALSYLDEIRRNGL